VPRGAHVIPITFLLSAIGKRESCGDPMVDDVFIGQSRIATRATGVESHIAIGKHKKLSLPLQ
jgi:hypothetical protein